MDYTLVTPNWFYVGSKDKRYLVRTYPFKVFSLKGKKNVATLKKLITNMQFDKASCNCKDYSNYFSLELILTSRCNLACEYCYAKREDTGYYGLPERDMSKNEVKRAIDFSLDKLLLNMESNNSNDGIFDIYFMGGEPLLNKNSLMFSMQYLTKRVSRLHKKGIKIDIRPAISTNGTLVDEEIAKFFRDFNFTYVGVTIDGENHDLYRVYTNGKGTLDDIKKGIKILDKFDVNLKLVSVVPPGEVDKIDSIIGYYKKEGLLEKAFRISIVPRAPSISELDRSCVIPQKTLKDCIGGKDIKYTKKERNMFSKKIIYLAEKFDIDERDIEKKVLEAINLGGVSHHCPAGISKISVIPGGLIFPCHQLVNINKFCMGNTNDETDDRFIKVGQQFINRTVFKLDKCGSCLFQTICPPLVDCPARSYHEEKSLYKTPQYCEMYKDYIARTFEKFLVNM